MEHTATATLVRTDAEDVMEDHGRAALADHGTSFTQPVQPTSYVNRDRFASEGRAVLAFSFAVYLIVAVLLDFKYTTFNGDAFARMANGFYVLYSRDPHLAAIGFVWTPLQSLADMVLLLGNHVWPALSHNDMAGSLVSALAMAGAAYQIRTALLEWGIGRAPRLILTAFFALNPMILYYAGNGMSEGLYLFTLVAATRYLLRWMHVGELRSLAYAAIALGFSYLTRNEAAGAAVVGALAVGAVSFWRVRGPRRSRTASAAADAAIFAFPAFIAAAGWAITSKVITGQYFGQFSSIYGNAEEELFLQHKSFEGRVLYVVHAITAFWPLLPIVLLISIYLAVRRRDPRMLAPLAVLGGALGFDAFSLIDNSIENSFRYFIVTIPLEILIVGSLLAAISSNSNAKSDESRAAIPTSRAKRSPRSAVAVLCVLIAMIPATVTTAAAMFNPNIGVQETEFLGFIFHKHLSEQDVLSKENYPTIIQMGNYFANLHLPDGDVIVDNAELCVPQLITTISQPKLFVIPNDRDFQRELADPLTFHAHYIFEPDPQQNPISAPNIEYPWLWSDGFPFVKEVHQFPSLGGCQEMRLFKVLRHPDQLT